MHTENDITNEIRSFVLHTFPLARSRSISNSTPLDGIIDSLGIIEIATFVEAHFGMEILDDDLVAEHFESIEALSKLIQSRTSRVAG